MHFYGFLQIADDLHKLGSVPLHNLVLGIRQPANKGLAVHIYHVGSIVVVNESEEPIASFALRMNVLLAQKVEAVDPRDKVTAIHFFPMRNTPTGDALA